MENQVVILTPAQRREMLWIMSRFNPRFGDEDFRIFASLTDQEFKEEMDKFSKAFVYVITWGHDCDGFEKDSVTKYSDWGSANIAAGLSTQAGDGIIYAVVDERGAREYCRDRDMKFHPDMLVFNVEGEVVNCNKEVSRVFNS